LNAVRQRGILSEKGFAFDMIHRLAVLITHELDKHTMIKKNDYNVIRYGMELLISSLVGTLIIFVISILYNRWYLAMIYTICFVPFRMTTGGYHAKSYFWCNFTVAWSYALVLEALLFLERTTPGMGWIFPVALFIYGALFFWTPVEHANKPISNDNREYLRRKGIWISTLWISSAVVMYGWFYEISCFIILCLFTVACSVVAAKLENKLQEVFHYEKDTLEDGK
jgi:accessory gene regulator B